MEEVFEEEYSSFKEQYGDDAVPVNDTDDFNKMKRRGENVVMVGYRTYDYITSAASYEEPETVSMTYSGELLAWFEEAKEYLPEDLRETGEQLVNGIVEILG